MSDYRTYQQVLNLSIRSADKVKKPKAAKKSPTPNTSGKTRTKTGCLTCRKRKKKCDENIVNGKCQGCTRNFLDCSWPVLSTLKQQEKEFAPSRKMSVSSDCSDCSTISASTVATNASYKGFAGSKGFTSPQGFTTPNLHSYPSPKSPIDEFPIKLPPLRLNRPVSAEQEKKDTAKIKPTFVITSLEKNEMCFIKQ